MSKRSTGFGHIFERSGAWHTRFNIRVKGKSVQKSIRLCAVDQDHTSKESMIELAREVVNHEQAAARDKEQTRNSGKCPTCGRYTKRVSA